MKYQGYEWEDKSAYSIEWITHWKDIFFKQIKKHVFTRHRLRLTSWINISQASALIWDISKKTNIVRCFYFNQNTFSIERYTFVREKNEVEVQRKQFVCLRMWTAVWHLKEGRFFYWKEEKSSSFSPSFLLSLRMSLEINPSYWTLHAMSRRKDRIQLTTNF